MNTKLSKYLGVTRGNGTRWKAQIRVSRKTHYLGEFDTEDEAARAYDNCLHALIQHGERRRVLFNFPSAWGSGDKSNPAYTDATNRIVNIFLGSGEVERAPSYSLSPTTKEHYCAVLLRHYNEDVAYRIQLSKRLIETAEILSQLGHQESYTEQQERFIREKQIENEILKSKKS